MNKLLPAVLLATLCFANDDCLARGGFSSGGGRSSGFSASRSYSPSSRTYGSPSRTTVTRTTTINRGYGGGYYGGYGYHPLMMGPFGMGYMYSNGLMEGIIIGSLMHPQGTTVYSGGGYNGQALLYPDGRVVDQNGYQVGVYANGQFTAQAGGLVAQPAPQGQPVVIDSGPSESEVAGIVVVVLLVILVIVAILA